MGLFSLIGRLLRGSRERRGNAPVDPLGGTAPTAAGLTAEFRILRAPSLLAMSGRMPKYEDLAREPASPWFTPDAPPAAVIFVSHRWESSSHPDPSGTQAHALRAFLTAVRDVARTSRSSPDERRACVPSLLVHGVLQAAYFLENGISFCQPGAGRWHTDDPRPEDILERVGIWYDFSCMPQDGPADLSLVRSLERIHQLIGESTKLILRWPGDDYDARAWCASEISMEPDISRHQCERIVLRVDRLLHPFPMKQLVQNDAPRARAPDPRTLAASFASAESTISDSIREGMASHLTRWVDDPDVARGSLYMLYGFLSEIEDQREMPLFTARRNPELFHGQLTLLIEMMHRLGAVSKSDFALPKHGRIDADVAKEVLGWDPLESTCRHASLSIL